MPCGGKISASSHGSGCATLSGMIRAGFFLSLIAFLFSASGSAQNAAPTPIMPNHPKDLMLLAAKVNGLQGVDHPWHLKANYQTFDADGKPKDEGVFEEWWAGPEKYKISYLSNGFSQVRYGTSKGLLMTGGPDSPPLGESMVEWFLTHPLPDAHDIKAQEYSEHDQKDGSLALQCILENSKVKSPIMPAFCFTKHVPAIRIEAVYGGFVAYFNNIVLFDGQYSAGKLEVVSQGRPILTADVTDLEPLAKIDDTMFTPPAGAVTATPMPLVVAPSATDKLRVSGMDPIYPAIAKAARIAGTVVIAVTISPEGKVKEAHVIYGPPMLQEAALEAVRTWKYKPYVVNEQPVEVRTDINVVYTLSLMP